MSRVRIDWLGNRGFRELRRSAGAQALVTETAEKVAARASAIDGHPYEVSPYVGKNRARASVSPASYAAVVSNRKRDTLVRAMFGGG